MIEELNRPLSAEPELLEDGAEDLPPVVYYMGHRIYFRPLELGDEPLLRRWINDPRVWATLHTRGPLNACREREWISNLGKDPAHVIFGIVLREDDRLIGNCGLHQIQHPTRSASFGLAIGDTRFHNQGYGTEATRLTLRYGFRELNLNRIELTVYADNWRAIRAYQKAGFTCEGCLRQSFYRNGRYVDAYRFAILREEWESLPTLTPGISDG